jgi:hypothetical protein
VSEPGNYDHHALALLELTAAEGVLVLVIEGGGGTGFACRYAASLETDEVARARVTRELPALLRQLAAELEGQLLAVEPGS